MKPSCYNRPDFKPYVAAQIGWTDDGRRDMAYIPDEMSKGCQQWGPLGEATLHGWDCDGCRHKPGHNAPGKPTAANEPNEG